MKAIDIATKNHVSSEHILLICNELGIQCQDQDSEISEKDLFLVEKKIEVIKAEKAKKTRELIEKKTEKSTIDQNRQTGKKIKLKRKVHVSKELIKEKPAEHETHETKEEIPIKSAPTPVEEKKEFEEKPKKEKIQKDNLATTKQKTTQRTDHDKAKKKTDTKESLDQNETIKEHTKAVPGKKLKKKDKEKEKDIKKTFKDDKYKEKEIFVRKKRPDIATVEKEKIFTPEQIEIVENITVGDLAHKLNIKAKNIITKLMNMGVMATINQVIDAETAEILAAEYNTKVKVVSLFEETIIKTDEIDKPEDRESRPPIVTVMGHVDHGKTKLLDTIRKTNVIDQEFGGITQHIGAYMVKVNDQYITFLDTPGHAAFTTMRARGAKVTDIVILVVAANDGIMPQTIEAIDHAKDADVPIIVAINKIDLPDTNIPKIKQELAQYGLVPEEWGGETLFTEISAKHNINIEELLELVLIQAEMLELEANPKLMASGIVIEAKLDPGRGSVLTILVQQGSLHVSDPFIVGINSGKVRAMFDDKGQSVTEATPSTPVEVLGVSSIPSAGDIFQVVDNEKYSKQIAQKRRDLKRLESAKKVKKVTLENLNEMIKEGEIQELKIIIKADVDGSVQALEEALEKISSDEIRVKIIHAGTGGINESDIMLASASNAIIIGYHVRPTAKVTEISEKEGVLINYYNVIFEATADVKAAMEGMLSPDIKEEIIGTGEIKQIFKISKLGTVAGSLVTSGKVQNDNKIRLIREGVVIFDSSIKTLKRFQSEVSEVETNQECGFTIEGFNDIKEGDTFETYKIIEIAKTLDTE